MPVLLVGAEETQAPSISVVGVRLDGTQVLKHVALLPHLSISWSKQSPAPDYGPPNIVAAHLSPTVIHVTGDGFEVDALRNPYVIGWMSGIDSEQTIKAMKTVLEDILTRIHQGVLLISWHAHPPYSIGSNAKKSSGQDADTLPRIHPPESTIRGEHDNRPIGWSFSCAGFVLWCMKEITGVSLLADGSGLPDVTDQEVIAFFGLQKDPEDQRKRSLEEMGFVGRGPWKGVLPGYVIHSLKDGAVIPYQPSKLDASFPSP